MSQVILVISILIAAAVIIKFISYYNSPPKTEFLVFDKDTGLSLPNLYRVLDVKNIRSSGSAQFSESSLLGLVEKLNIDHNVFKEDLWIVDLRQESHGFINGKPVTWYKTRNDANKNYSTKQVLVKEHKLINDIKIDSSIDIYQLKKGFGGAAFKGDKSSVIVKSKQTEQQLVTKYGLNYERFSVLDHHHPDDQNVEKLINLYKALPKDSWLHFHCRGGRGRSSTFMAMIFILKFHSDYNFDEIINVQYESGSIDFKMINEDPAKSWKNPAAINRLSFLKDFYSYVLDPNGYRKVNWLIWVNQ